MSYDNNNLKGKIKLELLNYYDSMKSQIDAYGQSILLKDSIFKNKSEEQEFKKIYLDQYFSF